MSYKQTICVDFDGTIVDHEFPAIGKLKPGVMDALTLLIEKYDIVISSCRASKIFNPTPGSSPAYKEMVKFIHDNKIPHTRIDDGTEGKVVAIAYIDDRAIQYGGLVKDWELISFPFLNK